MPALALPEIELALTVACAWLCTTMPPSEPSRIILLSTTGSLPESRTYICMYIICINIKYNIYTHLHMHVYIYTHIYTYNICTYYAYKIIYIYVYIYICI